MASRAVYPLGTNAEKLSDAIDPSARRVAPRSRHKWHYITQANGLPMNPDAIAFGKDGIIYVGTQCGGLAVGTQRRGTPSNALGWSHYQWTIIKGPWHMPLAATGKGLPSNLINAVAVESGGRVVVGTDGGIAFGPSTTDAAPAALAVPSSASLLAAPRRAANNLRHSMQRAPRWASQWSFEHGRNFVAKVYGLWHPPVHWTPPSGPVLEQLPTEDHTTVVAWQPNHADGAKAGYLWLGHWRAGLDVWQYNADGKIIQRWHIHERQIGNYVESLQPLKGGAMAVGCYGKGVFIITLPGESKNAWRRTPVASNKTTTTPQPHGAGPPARQQLNRDLQAISGISPVPGVFGRVLPLSDDWRTDGNWIGRYGRYWSCLFAMGTTSQQGFNWMQRPKGDRVWLHAAVGPGGVWGEGLRYWICSRASANRRSLEIPPSHLPQSDRSGNAGGQRHFGRETECDDHGEIYPMSQSGPGIRCRLHLPAGLFEIGLYDANFDGHGGTDRLRDYVISVVGDGQRHAAFRTTQARRSRVVGFFNGVYKRWLAVGPAEIHLKMRRNHSFNTIVAALFVDRVAGDRTRDVGPGNLPRVWASPTAWRWLTRPHRTALGAAKRLAALLPALATFNMHWYAANWRLGFTELLRWDIHRLDAGQGNRFILRNAYSCGQRLSLFYLRRLRGQPHRDLASPHLDQAAISTQPHPTGVRRVLAAEAK